MKSEDLLRYEAEYEAMQAALGTRLLVFAWAPSARQEAGEAGRAAEGWRRLRQRPAGRAPARTNRAS